MSGPYEPTPDERRVKPWLGKWRWYVGCDEGDDEMMECLSRDEAIREGQRQYQTGETFYVVEARMRVSDEQAMGRGTRDTAPFAETRNGAFITNGPRIEQGHHHD